MLKKGQRWISRMEPELGLGTVVAVEKDGRRVGIRFDGGDLTRHYVVRSAPLERVAFSSGDRVSLQDGTTLVVETVDIVAGLFIYHGQGRKVSETMLSPTMSFSSPADRLAAGLVDATATFDLRYQAHLLQHRYRSSSVMGFLGGRLERIPHQFYIAREVTSRLLPRVLLADETGLGKTMEAGLIVHRLLLSERIGRVLILVPDALVHQWFVEMYRRFNLSFRIISPAEPADTNRGDNPFLEDQLCLCPMALLENASLVNQRESAASLALAAGWDMVVVDEAHHVTPQGVVHDFLKQTGHAGAGMLLLTATPEQLGTDRHFMHLKLLDPHRYTTLAAYRESSFAYEKLAADIETRLVRQPDNDTFLANADTILGRELETLLDCHGPGRAIFRNTRSVIKGFPDRRGLLYPLASVLETASWLAGRLKHLKDEKVLVICSTRERAQVLAEELKKELQIKFTLFHESMTLLQRDRSAAWFSEPDGARLMICSEIGSEGRNFQFCSHLVLLDLPRNPELLEQRIGRLDRIGQTRKISIHVPYVENSPEDVLAHWYDRGVGIFNSHVSGIHQLHEPFQGRIEALCRSCDAHRALDRIALETLIRDTRRFNRRLQDTLSRGRDRLLEINSYRPLPAARLVAAIQAEDEKKDLEIFLLSLFDFFNVSHDRFLPRTHRITFETAHPAFPVPLLKKDGMTITFDRNMAVTRGEIDFITWDHPLVHAAVELLLGTEQGNCSVVSMDGEGTFSLLLETVHLLECVSPGYLHMDRFLPATPVRVVVNHSMESVTGDFPPEAFQGKVTDGDDKFLREYPEIKESLLPGMIRAADAAARRQVDNLLKNAAANIQRTMEKELHRLERLQAENPGVVDPEIALARITRENLEKMLAASRLRLDGLRLIRRG